MVTTLIFINTVFALTRSQLNLPGASHLCSP